MTHQVLALKWRPTNFKTVVGQQHVVQALENALKQKRLHHAYLFTGTRGVGKTTIARILAKCLNCETGITATPCEKCHACIECSEGRFVDLIEVDAASRTKVEDTRELLNNVKYMPTRGRYKIYLIDEVHMLSSHSFNALLKTLEEPPEYVVFLLATTNPKKLPITVLSRCLQFHLKNLTSNQITSHLEYIVKEEHINFEEEALKQIAKAAKGSMRDALSLLDQVIAFGNGQITNTNTNALLGTIDQLYIDQLLKTIAIQDGKTTLEISEKLSDLGADFNYILECIISRLHEISLTQIIPGHLENNPNNATLIELAQQMDPETIQLYYQIALMGRRDLDIVEDKQIGFQMTLLRMFAFTLDQAKENKTKSNEQILTQKPQTKTINDTLVKESKSRTTSNTPHGNKISLEHDWDQLSEKLNLKGMARVFASHCALKKFEKNHLLLSTSSEYKPLFSQNIQKQIHDALNSYFGQTITLQVEFTETVLETPASKQKQKKKELHQKAIHTIQNDTNIETLTKTFGVDLQLNLVESMDK